MKYTGDLATPIPLMRRPSLAEDIDAVLAAESKRIASEWFRKLGLLMAAHGVSPEDDMLPSRLLLALIEAHVPGMTTGRKRDAGAPSYWTSARRAALVADVERLMSGGKGQVTDACRSLVSDKKYLPVGKARGTSNDRQAESLARRYRAAAADPIVLAFRTLAAAAGPAAWEHLRDIALQTVVVEEEGERTGKYRI